MGTDRSHPYVYEHLGFEPGGGFGGQLHQATGGVAAAAQDGVDVDGVSDLGSSVQRCDLVADCVIRVKHRPDRKPDGWCARQSMPSSTLTD